MGPEAIIGTPAVRHLTALMLLATHSARAQDLVPVGSDTAEVESLRRSIERIEQIRLQLQQDPTLTFPATLEGAEHDALRKTLELADPDAGPYRIRVEGGRPPLECPDCLTGGEPPAQTPAAPNATKLAGLDPVVGSTTQFPAIETDGADVVGIAGGTSVELQILGDTAEDGTSTVLVTPALPARGSGEALVDVVAVGVRGRWHCSGLVVGPSHVLTAAHCLPADRILLGPSVERPEQVVDVIRHIPHPGGLDAAIVEVEDALGVRPRQRRRARTEPVGDGLLTGFGRTAQHTRSGTKLEARIRVDGWGCPSGGSCRPRQELVVAGQGGVDTCDGDSGSPLMLWEEGRWVVLGITSRPVAGSRVPCGDGGVYVRADALWPWIDETLRPEGESP